ncbi:hypothetical protein L596_021971 [Steinernema carpocapsae]|uniref:3'-5' exonuclease domain-containing protein n=1 Tax=Steinernema carpocapsae TaxID=34508 RepID=A0A4U5MKD2_STECR|nr:hypothetical protein L596_021971 [Steinernema carpocapsae]
MEPPPTPADQIKVIVDKFLKKQTEDSINKNEVRDLLKNALDSGQAFMELIVETEKIPNQLLVKKCLEVFGETDVVLSREIQSEAFGLINKKKKAKKEQPNQKPSYQKRKLADSFKYFVRAFKFDDMTVSLEDHVKTFISEGDYVSAATVLAYGPARLLSTYDHEALLNELIIPLFTIENTTTANCKELLFDLLKHFKAEKRFLDYLNGLLIKSKAEQEAVVYESKEFCEAKPAFEVLKTFMADLIKKTPYEKEEFENLRRATILGELVDKFVIQTEKDFEDSWRVAMASKHGGTWLQADFINKLLRKAQATEAEKSSSFIQAASKYASWNEFYKTLDVTVEPYCQLEVANWEKCSVFEPLQENPMHYHLDGFEVHFCKTDTAEEIDSITEIITNLPGSKKQPYLIHLDCEFQALCVSNCRAKVALLQFSIPKNVYLVDCHSMDNSALFPAWKGFFEAFFKNKKTRIFGLGLCNDMTNLKGSFPELKTMKKTKIIYCETLIACLANGAKDATLNKLKEGLKDRKDKKKIGLKTVHGILFPDSEELDKDQQRTAFDQRPLRKEQLDYAATDVYVLHEIFNKLKELYVAEHKDNGEIKFEECLKKSEKTDGSILLS